MKLLITKIMPAMLFTLCLSGMLACASRTVEKRGAHSDVGAKTFAVALEKPATVVVLDVRTAAEYAEGHVLGLDLGIVAQLQSRQFSISS